MPLAARCQLRLSDEAWALIAPLLPAAMTTGRARKRSYRLLLEAVLYLLRTGCQWRALPAAFLGMVLPVEGEPAALGVAGLRVEQGRVVKSKPYDLASDPKYTLTQSVEALFAPASPAVAAPAVRPHPAAPPKRTYRQGGI